MVTTEDGARRSRRSAGVLLSCFLFGLSATRVIFAMISLGRDGAPWQIVIQLVPVGAIVGGLGWCLWARHHWAQTAALILVGLAALAHASTLAHGPRPITLTYGSHFYDISPTGHLPLAGRIVSLVVLVIAFGLLLKDELDHRSDQLTGGEQRNES